MNDLRDKVVLVTGASRGLGALIAHALAAEGARLALAARSADDITRLADELRAGGAEAEPVPTDVTDAAARERLVARTIERFGRIDVLVNNAGIELLGALSDARAERIDQLFAVNIVATAQLSRAVLPHMLAQRSGLIVNMASMAGKAAIPYNSIYSASKAAVIFLTLSLRDELRGTGVTASVVCPGFVTGTGMYEDMRAQTGIAAPALVGTVGDRQVVATVLRAIRRQGPEYLVYRGPVRPILALAALFPGLYSVFNSLTGLRAAFARSAQAANKGDRKADA